MPATDPRLDLEPPSASVHVWCFALGVLLPVAIGGVALLHSLTSDSPKSLIAGSEVLTVVIVLAGACLLTLAIWWFYLRRTLRPHHLILGSHSLEIHTGFQRQPLALSELDLASARVVDLGERTELKPLLRTHGTDFPGFRSGWFRLRNRRRAFVAITTGPRVLFMPTRNGYDLLLQPRQPQALLERLRTLATAAERR